MDAQLRPATAVQTKQDIFERIQRHRAELRRYGVKRLGLFGSFVRDEQVPDSDVDLLVEFEPGMKTYRNFIQIHELLEAHLGRGVEVLTLEALSPYIGPRILKTVEYAAITN